MMGRASRERLRVLAAAAIVALASSRGVYAREAGPFVLQMPDGPVRVDHVAARVDGPRPAVIVLSGSKGFGSIAYAEMSGTLNARGLDVFELHALSSGDLSAIAGAGDAHARIAYHATAFRRWTAAVHALVARLTAEPRSVRGIGILGISLGAEIAAVATAEGEGIRALVLVDGGFPSEHMPSTRALPPLMLIWGGADHVFPPAAARKLAADVRSHGGSAVLKIYEGGRHDFFVQPGTAQAAEAQTEAATFLASQLE